MDPAYPQVDPLDEDPPDAVRCYWNSVFNKAGSETDTNAQILTFLLKIGTREEELFRAQRDLRASSAELTTLNLKSSEQTRRNDNK
jgi:hypothetical protein